MKPKLTDKITDITIDEFLDFWISAVISEENIGKRISYGKCLKFVIKKVLKYESN